jgi:acetoin utilization protein AcuC
MTDGPLLVYGPWSDRYDFGPGHPLTPRRFGPGIDLLRAVGAEPGLAPEPAADQELLAVHARRYVEVVKRLSADPDGPPEAGIGGGDNPPFPGMHEAAAAVAGGSLRAMEALLRGDVEHAHHPGGGLHHAMRDRASGFCVYDDPALAIARARRDGLRVLYVDLDVHHGDGVEAIFRDDPSVLTLSFHESGRYLFPGTGWATEVGEGAAAGTVVNVPFEPLVGESAWLGAVRRLLPELAASFGADIIVSQHGADSHAWDPLANLRVTTTAMSEAARLVDAVAHRWGSGRWLATGGGGYDVYRVVPRAWALTWLAGAHREVPSTIPAAWRERWAAEAERWGQAPPPERFLDEPNAGVPIDRAQELADLVAGGTVDLVRRAVVPELIREAVDRRWWTPLDGSAPVAVGAPEAAPTIGRLDRAGLEGLRLASRVVAPATDAGAGLELLRAVAAEGGTIVGAVSDGVIVGAAVVAADRIEAGRERVLALGVAPGLRRRGIARALLAALVELGRPLVASVTLAERDPVEPVERRVRALVARRLLEGAGFRVSTRSDDLGRIDPDAVTAVRE